MSHIIEIGLNWFGKYKITEKNLLILYMLNSMKFNLPVPSSTKLIDVGKGN